VQEQQRQRQTATAAAEAAAAFTSTPTKWLRTRRFSKPTFRTPVAAKHWRNTSFRDFSTFSLTLIFFILLSSSFLFSDLPSLPLL
jgi:hypothetical protein